MILEGKLHRSRTRLKRRLGRPFLRAVLITAMVAAGGSPLITATAAHAATPPTGGPTYADVSSTQEWQQAPVTLHRGDKIDLWYERGSWSVDHVNFPYVGPVGYSSDVDQRIYQGCKLNAKWAYGLMLGRIGDGQAVVIGRGTTITADRDGPLELRIHDTCLGDNDGAIRMEYQVEKPAPPKPPQDFPWAGYGLHPDGGTHVKSVMATWKVPTVNCANGGRAAVWVGMWGTVKDSWLPQIGTSSDCDHQSSPHVVYQIPTVPGAEWLTSLSGLQYLDLYNPGELSDSYFPVHANDQISASVTYEGTNLIGGRTFKISIKNQSTGQEWSRDLTTVTPANLDQVAGEGGAIVEDDQNGLAEFNPGGGHRLDITGLHATFDRDPAHWTAKSYQIALNGHYLIDPVSKLTSNGSFSVTWKATK